MSDQVSTFLYGIFGEDVEGMVATGRIGDGATRPITNSRFWRWPEQADELVDFVDQHNTEDVYFSPMLYGEQRRTKDAVTYTPVLWADTDSADPEDFDLDPSIVVETSKGRWQAYWCLTETVSPLWAEAMSKQITYSRLEEGSDYGWALSKYLRIPGTVNTKPGRENYPVTVKFIGTIYSAEEVEKVYGETSFAATSFVDRDLPPNLPTKADVLAKIPSDPAIERALNVQDKPAQWSETRWWLECELFRNGLEAEEVFVAMLGSAQDKYTNRDNRSPNDLWKEILRAEQATIKDQVAYTGPDLSEEDYVQSEPAPELLSKKERASLERTFIDDYVEWAATRTNGDVGYHEFAAMCALSTVLSDFGHAAPSFGALKLNMWFMLLGVTTRTYKTTARKLMLEIVGKIESDDYEYDLGSDTTSEGLIRELSEHPGRSVLFHRDEANSMLQDAKGGKSYMSGFGETLTELYDGHVRGRLRATGDNKKVKSVETAFNLMLIGVPEKMSTVLTTEDFASGFLARFMYVIGRPEPYSKQAGSLRQMDTKDIEHDDIARTSLRNRVLSMRTFWSHQTDPGDSIPVRCDEDAWDRFNEALHDLDKVAHESSLPEIMEPCVNRMNKMILKLATLLAMAEKQKTVALTHMLTAIKYSEKWYQHLSMVIHMVGRTEFGAQVEALVAYVSHGPKPYAATRRNFKNMTQRQWNEIMSAAQDQKLIDVQKGKGNAQIIVAL